MTETSTVIESLQTLLACGFASGPGRLEAIFIRPSTNEREELDQATLTRNGGVPGDRWHSRDQRTQITLMNARVLDCVARGDRSRWALAGDQLIVDLDLSEQNLPVGQQLLIGDARLEVTDVPHTGCHKFKARFGSEALDFINSPDRRHLRLRGMYVKVVTDGTVRVGDTIQKVGG